MSVLLGWALVAVVVLALGLLVTVASRPRRARPSAAGQRPALAAPIHPVQVESLRDRLGHDLRTLAPGTDAVSRQALADAAERFDVCSLVLQRAREQAELRTAWLAAVEGLTSTRLVRARQGLDPGPEVPLPPELG